MRRSRFTKPIPTIARLLASLLLATLAVPVGAQLAADSQRRSNLGYDRAHEITLTGTIQKVASKSAPGSPVGVHLLVAGPQGTVDAHLGPYLSTDTLEALQAGALVQIVGAVESPNGKEYLLVRQLIFGGRLITVRSENGFLLREHAPRPVASRAEERSQNELNGGVR